ncbi:hypothetical protein Bca52824_062923 [Brassica carinata]|uniref:Uncharacterized protein n=1 Tax=Brassica carinata TaxID=52824 RepID=A0A8X7QHY9_BRACI|nr:hypothetical protein Bca52824_062923 [Brassica carinata]
MMKPSAKSIQRVGRFLRKSLGSIKSTVCFGKHHNFSNNSTPLLSHPCPQDSQTEETYSVSSCESTAVADTKDERPINKSQHKKKPKKKVAAEPFEEAKRRGDMLAQKMKDLNMVDFRDVEHALDVREALRCYSSIRSPVYLDIVDNFSQTCTTSSLIHAPLPVSTVQEGKLALSDSKTHLDQLRFR